MSNYLLLSKYFKFFTSTHINEYASMAENIQKVLDENKSVFNEIVIRKLLTIYVCYNL